MRNSRKVAHVVDGPDSVDPHTSPSEINAALRVVLLVCSPSLRGNGGGEGANMTTNSCLLSLI
jgi:hypothetical protein